MAGGAFLGLVFGLTGAAVDASYSVLSRQRNKRAADTPNTTVCANAAPGATSDQWPLERPASRVTQSHEPSVGSVMSSGDPILQTALERRVERRQRRERERIARIGEVLRNRMPSSRLVAVVEEERSIWLAKLLKHESNAEKLRKVYAEQNLHLLYRLGGAARRQRKDMRAMPLEKLREWNSTLERQYALTLAYAMRMSNGEHFTIGLKHFFQANIVIQSICIPILALSFVSYEFAPGLYQVLQFPGTLAALLEMGMLMHLFTINDWNRTGEAGARVELDKKQRTASRELAGWLDSHFSISSATQNPPV